MSRWLAYYGKAVLLERVLYGWKNALVEEKTGGTDRIGIGWYSGSAEPEAFRSTEPSSSDHVRELAGRVESHLFLVHIRTPSGTAVEEAEAGSQPFQHGRWLWMHDGLVDGWSAIESDLVPAVDPKLHLAVEGATASEVLFLLALTHGLEKDPPGAVERTVGLVEEAGRRHGLEHPFRGPIAATDGERLWVFRYSSNGSSPPISFSTRLQTLQALYPDDPRLDGFDEDSRIVVSEPLGYLPGVWNDVPEGMWGVVQPGQDEFGTFRPAASVPA